MHTYHTTVVVQHGNNFVRTPASTTQSATQGTILRQNLRTPRRARGNGGRRLLVVAACLCSRAVACHTFYPNCAGAHSSDSCDSACAHTKCSINTVCSTVTIHRNNSVRTPALKITALRATRNCNTATIYLLLGGTILSRTKFSS